MNICTLENSHSFTTSAWNIRDVYLLFTIVGFDILNGVEVLAGKW